MVVHKSLMQGQSSGDDFFNMKNHGEKKREPQELPRLISFEIMGESHPRLPI